MDFLLGSPEEFAIQCKPQPSRSQHLFGELRIWLGGRFVGTERDVAMLTAILHQLVRLTEADIECERCDDLDEETVYRSLKTDDNVWAGKYLFSPGETFDDFSIIVYANKGKLKFLWELRQDPYFEYPNYPEGIQSAVVSLNRFRQVVGEFRQKLEELKRL